MINTYVYLLRCADGTLYTGVSTDPAKRLSQHNKGKGGAKYTRGRGPCVLLACAAPLPKGGALRLERLVKKQPAAKKLRALARGMIDGIH